MSYGLAELGLLALLCCITIVPVGAGAGLIVWLLGRKMAPD